MANSMEEALDRLFAARDLIRANYVQLGIAAEDADLPELAAASFKVAEAFSDKADKKTPSASGNVALLGSDGNLVDSGKQLTPSGIGAESLISRGAYFGDLNAVGNTAGTLYDNSVVWFSTPNGTSHAPASGYGIALTWSNGGGYYQELHYTDGSVYWRMYYNGGSGDMWHDWFKMSSTKV